jgi:hypothetical protein
MFCFTLLVYTVRCCVVSSVRFIVLCLRFTFYCIVLLLLYSVATIRCVIISIRLLYCVYVLFYGVRIIVLFTFYYIVLLLLYSVASSSFSVLG